MRHKDNARPRPSPTGGTGEIVADLFESMGLISQLKEFRGKGEGFVFRFT